MTMETSPPKITSFIHYMIIQNNRKLEKYYGQNPNSQKWTDMDQVFMLKLGRLALKLLDNNRSVFYEEELKEYSLPVREKAWWSGLCAELARAIPKDKPVFCFTHLSFLEFMAAHYIFTFRLEERNVLDQSYRVTELFKEHSLVDMYRKAVDRYLSAPVGQYDLFLRFLCDLSMTLNYGLLRGMLFPHNAPPLKGLEDVVRLLTKRKDSAGPERQANLSECLRQLEDVVRLLTKRKDSAGPERQANLSECLRLLTKRKDSAGPERQANLSECLRQLEESED
ncbi:hypothetical protein J4Q44_G00339100 [Coregonus suidteri]|uniref:Uncharacterized protein n=1 Tax=Coregonus suidteri TaxID=861788 RepID=A0AAN8QNJ3_9TELE